VVCLRRGAIGGDKRRVDLLAADRETQGRAVRFLITNSSVRPQQCTAWRNNRRGDPIFRILNSPGIVRAHPETIGQAWSGAIGKIESSRSSAEAVSVISRT